MHNRGQTKTRIEEKTGAAVPCGPCDEICQVGESGRIERGYPDVVFSEACDTGVGWRRKRATIRICMGNASSGLLISGTNQRRSLPHCLG